MYWVPQCYGGGSWIAPAFFIGVLFALCLIDDVILMRG